VPKQSFRNRNRFWLFFFAIWILLLSGIFEPWIGAPGLKQKIQVRNLLNETRAKSALVESEVASLEETRKQLETNPVAQEREIRKVLGYLAPGEVVFEF